MSAGNRIRVSLPKEIHQVSVFPLTIHALAAKELNYTFFKKTFAAVLSLPPPTFEGFTLRESSFAQSVFEQKAGENGLEGKNVVIMRWSFQLLH